MKKIVLISSLAVFMFVAAFAVNAKADANQSATAVEMVAQDDKKDDKKKECTKGEKKECTKGEKKACTKGEKKACSGDKKE